MHNNQLFVKKYIYAMGEHILLLMLAYFLTTKMNSWRWNLLKVWVLRFLSVSSSILGRWKKAQSVLFLISLRHSNSNEYVFCYARCWVKLGVVRRLVWLHDSKDTAEPDSIKIRVGHWVLFCSVASVLFCSLKGMFRSFPFFFRVFGDLWDPKERSVLF